ncbi:MAG: NTP transferase domain-containing protein, partial [Candidatus Hydrogenedentota bacterium]
MPNSPPVCAIILSAGESRRMGQQKLLLPYGGKPVIRYVFDQIVTGGVTRTIVVTGFDHERIIDALADTPAEFSRNIDFARGMLSSVRH